MQGEDGVPPPPPDYDDGPESGYTTSDHDQQSSESDYPIHTQPQSGHAHTIARTNQNAGIDHVRNHHGDGSQTLPPALPERASKISQSSMPGYHAPGLPAHGHMGVPAPPLPPGAHNVTAEVHHSDTIYQTRLPDPVPPPPPMESTRDELYEAQLPQGTGYIGQDELYQHTLPTPVPDRQPPRAPPPATMPKRGPSQGVPPPPPPMETLPRLNTNICPPPPPMALNSPESDLPPPPPPINFGTLPAATNGVGLPAPPQKMTPPVLPKPAGRGMGSPPMSPASSTSSASLSSWSSGGASNNPAPPAPPMGGPPAPPPLPQGGSTTLPIRAQHQGSPVPAAPPAATMPRPSPPPTVLPPSGPVGKAAIPVDDDLAAKLARVRMRADIPQNEQIAAAERAQNEEMGEFLVSIL